MKNRASGLLFTSYLLYPNFYHLVQLSGDAISSDNAGYTVRVVCRHKGQEIQLRYVLWASHPP